jgi:hypothetical protein
MRWAEWIAASDQISESWYCLRAFVKAIETHGEMLATAGELRLALTRVAQLLRSNYQKELPKLAQRIENVLRLGYRPTEPLNTALPQRPSVPDPAKPAMVGSRIVLVQLKQFLGILPGDAVAATEIGFDHFPLRDDSPFRAEHEMINMFLSDVVGTRDYQRPALSATESGRAMQKLGEVARGKRLLAVAERCANIPFISPGGVADHRCWQSQYALVGLFETLSRAPMQFDRESQFDVLLYLSALNTYQWTTSTSFLDRSVAFIEESKLEASLTPGERHVIHRLRCRAIRTCPFGDLPPEAARLSQLLGDGRFFALVPGDAWADAVNEDLGKLDETGRTGWLEILRHASSATGSRPSAKWLKAGKDGVRRLGTRKYRERLLRWFGVINVKPTIRILSSDWNHREGGDTFHDDNATCLRGLLWMAPEVATPDLIRAVGNVTQSCYRKIPGVGPRAVKVANAGVFALSQINDPAAVGQLALLKVKVKFGTAQKEIEKAFTAAAERSGLPRDEIEEMSVPTYGLTEVGVGEEKLGEFTARLTVTGTTSTALTWVKSDGKPQRTVPAEVKQSHKEELKELQAAAKDIQGMLPAQRERIDSLFLEQKSWPVAVWQERYLNHPLVGTLARRILWDFGAGDKAVTGIWFDGKVVDLDLRAIAMADPAMTVRLWHPIGKSAEEVTACRSFLEAQRIQQPFKQAHREIYLLTDAERNTRVYSNRYAAHILKQHQFNALCALRGWKNKLRLMVDDEYPPATLNLPKWGLRAEFWVEGAGTEYGTDTNDSGVYLRVATDQLRFYPMAAAQQMAHAGGGGYRPGWGRGGAEPLPLEQIPALVLSEVMRDVDLFAGVASVGNDPTWNDGGPEGRYRAYWQSYSFGELNASAKTRKEVLERLVPKLKIAGRCSFVEKFLIVKGSVRTYKIHLGSGNILMEPNDQYLCIVAKQGEAEGESVLLPFEGDRTLSIILSKAFLLAEDRKIKDPAIVNQIIAK